eukprot:2709264-Heterocapsa_arctica.AAC.1
MFGSLISSASSAPGPALTGLGSTRASWIRSSRAPASFSASRRPSAAGRAGQGAPGSRASA